MILSSECGAEQGRRYSTEGNDQAGSGTRVTTRPHSRASEPLKAPVFNGRGYLKP